MLTRSSPIEIFEYISGILLENIWADIIKVIDFKGCINRDVSYSCIQKNSKQIFFLLQDRRDLLKDDDATSESSDPRDILKDPRAILAGLPPLPALEAFNRQTRDFLNSPQALLANLKQFGNGPPSGPLIPPSLPPSSLGPLPPLPRPPSQPPTPNSQRSSPVGGAGGGSNQGNWSFEEQFKQVGDMF